MDDSMKVTKELMKMAIETHVMMICENHAELSGLMDFISKSGYDVDYFIDWGKYDNAISALAEALTEAFNDLAKCMQSYDDDELAELGIKRSK